MKFLIVTDDSQMSSEQTLQRMDANQRWVEESRKGGKLQAIYSLAGNHGVVMIVDVDSPESLDELMISMPVACEGTKLQIQVLADYDVAMRSLSKNLKSSLTAMKSG